MAKDNNIELQPTRLPLRILAPHPLQDYFYDEASAADDAALAGDLRDNGQRDPIHVMPPKNKAGLQPYTMLDGHRRSRLLAEAGVSDAVVVIRHDLAEADEATAEREFLKFNLVRRQLHPIDKARAVLRVYHLEKGLPRDKQMRQADEQEVRDRIGSLIGMSGRNLSRYFRLLLTPVEVQRAVRDGHLPLVLGEKIEGLSKAQQDEIASRIQAGEPPKEVVQEYVTPSDGRHKKTGDAMASFVRGLRRGLTDLEGRAEKISPKHINESRSILQAALDLIKRLLKARK